MSFIFAGTGTGPPEEGRWFTAQVPVSEDGTIPGAALPGLMKAFFGDAFVDHGTWWEVRPNVAKRRDVDRAKRRRKNREARRRKAAKKR